MIAQAQRSRPEVLALEGLLRSLGEQRTATRGARYPHVTVAATVDLANPNSRIFPEESAWNATWSVGAAIAWSPNELLAARERSSEEDAALARTHAEIAMLEDGIQLEVTRSLEDYGAARSAVEAASVGCSG